MIRLLFDYHSTNMQKLLPTYQAGKLRADPVFVNDPRERRTVYWPPDAQDVPTLMKDLIQFVKVNKNKIDPLILAGLFHKQMVVIHPYPQLFPISPSF